MEKCRKEKNLTLEALAKRVGVSKQYIWDIEDGRKVLSYRMAYKIASLLGKKPDEVFLEDYKKHSPKE